MSDETSHFQCLEVSERLHRYASEHDEPKDSHTFKTDFQSIVEQNGRLSFLFSADNQLADLVRALRVLGVGTRTLWRTISRDK